MHVVFATQPMGVNIMLRKFVRFKESTKANRSTYQVCYRWEQKYTSISFLADVVLQGWIIPQVTTNSNTTTLIQTSWIVSVKPAASFKLLTVTLIDIITQIRLICRLCGASISVKILLDSKHKSNIDRFSRLFICLQNRSAGVHRTWLMFVLRCLRFAAPSSVVGYLWNYLTPFSRGPDQIGLYHIGTSGFARHERKTPNHSSLTI